MTKIKAVLDQETWVEVDVPDEFQAIVTSLFCLDSIITGDSDDVAGNIVTDNSDAVSINDGLPPVTDSGVSSGQKRIERTESIESVPDSIAQVKPSPLSGDTYNNNSNLICKARTDFTAFEALSYF